MGLDPISNIAGAVKGIIDKPRSESKSLVIFGYGKGL
jgi:hypothetical protein